MAVGQYELRGKRATLNEFNVGMALERNGVDYLFQVSYWGGRNIRGGQILDFLAFAPFETPIQVFGEYWHTGMLSGTDRLKLQLLEAHFTRKVVIIWGKDSESIDDAERALRKNRVI